MPFRIMALGASITQGIQSSKGNGYRESLRTQLALGGNLVNMVGSKRNGSMIDSDNEGWPGFIIDQVHDKAKASVPQMKPNVILINAGTNDCIQNVDVANAGKRMENMINDLYTMSPGTTIILSSLIVNKQAATENRVGQVNPQYSALADRLRSAGKSIVFVDMHGPDGPQLADMADDTHPNDAGYEKMAKIWYKGFTEASDAKFLQRAVAVAGIVDDGAAQGAGNGRVIQSAPQDTKTDDAPSTTSSSAASSSSFPTGWLSSLCITIVFWVFIWVL